MRSEKILNWNEYKNLNNEQIEDIAKTILNEMSLTEKIDQLHGDWSLIKYLIKSIKGYCFIPIPAGENKRLGIPPIKFTDGPRGVVSGNCTCFPVSIARGATWDTDLEERIGNAIGIEARARGANFFGGVCINLLRHPAWGRAQETYGEDPYLLGKMGSSLIRGTQKHVMACAKHYACNSIENSRFKVSVNIDERTLHEIYLYHFKKCVENDVDSIMSAYNRVNGIYCGQNRHLLYDILKKEWNFQGIVVSDFIFGVRNGIESLKNGLDIEMPAKFKTKTKKILNALRKGEISKETIDESVIRILRKKLLQNTRPSDDYYPKSKIACDEHVNLSLEAARKSIVLLKNNEIVNDSGIKEKILPLKFENLKSIAILGRLSDRKNIGDIGSSNVHPPYIITPLDGITQLLRDNHMHEKISVLSYSGRNIQKAANIAHNADVAIVFIGYTYKDEGEYMYPILNIGGDRKSLRLNPKDEKLIESVCIANSKTIVVLIGGSAIITEKWKDKASAILMAWYGGMEGGKAIAEIIFGITNPSGKLPMTFPKSENQLPYFNRNIKEIKYEYYHGYFLFDKKRLEPAFPFGFGLSYTQFQYDNLEVKPNRIEIKDWNKIEESIEISVNVANIGLIEGDEIVQLYIGAPGIEIDRPLKQLKEFKRISLKPNQKIQVKFKLELKELQYYNEKDSKWRLEKGEYRVYVGSSSRLEDLLIEKFSIV